MANTQQRSNLPAFIVIALIIAAVVAVPFVMPHVSNAFLYPMEHEAEIRESAERHGVDPCLVCAIIRCESGWDADAVSEAGAQGLMQVMPDTALTMVTFGLVDSERYPTDGLLDPATNIEYGCACLEYLAGEFETDEQVIAAYNAGLGPVRIWIADAEAGERTFMETIEYRETRAYVTRVLVSFEGYRTSYPELAEAEPAEG